MWKLSRFLSLSNGHYSLFIIHCKEESLSNVWVNAHKNACTIFCFALHLFNLLSLSYSLTLSKLFSLFNSSDLKVWILIIPKYATCLLSQLGTTEQNFQHKGTTKAVYLCFGWFLFFFWFIHSPLISSYKSILLRSVLLDDTNISMIVTDISYKWLWPDINDPPRHPRWQIDTDRYKASAIGNQHVTNY